MKQKKTKFLTLVFFLFGITLFLYNCTLEENVTEPEKINLNNVKTVSFKNAITHFNSKKEKIQQKRTYAKGTENTLDITPDWNTLEHNEIAYTDAELTTANSEINRDGEYSSQLYFINVNNQIKNVIFTIWKDEVDQNGNIINGRIYFNNLEGKFIDGYRIENGVFTKSIIVKTPTQKASFLPLFLFQAVLQDYDGNNGGGGDCWNTDNLPDGGILDEVVIRSHNPNWHFTQGPGLGGANNYNYQNYVNNATNGFSTNVGGGTSLSSRQVTSAAAAIFTVAPINVDENGNCPDAYIKNNDNKCINNILYYESLLKEGIVFINPTEAKKIDPVEELKCFDLTKGAKLTIYVQQPKENSNQVIGPNQVGHAFIGIEQGGITRIIGYYPDKEVGLTGIGNDYDAAIKMNYNYLYHVNISQNVSSTQLKSIVNYAENFTTTYNTNNYACTDFAIAIGNLGGMGLPSTEINSFTFSGRSPGQLGQEIRARNSTSTTTISTTSSNSPSKQGTCN